MTNLKNTATAIALAAVLMVGTASANTETITQNVPQQKQCTVKDTNGIIDIVESFIKGIVLRMPRVFFAPRITLEIPMILFVSLTVHCFCCGAFSVIVSVFAEAVPTIRTAAKAIAVAVFFNFFIFFLLLFFILLKPLFLAW